MIIYHNNREIKTIKDLMKYKHIISTDDFTYKEFFDKNRTRIFQQLDNTQKCELAVQKHGENASIEDLTEGDLDYDMTLPFPCTLEVDIQYVTSIVEITETNFQENTDDFFVFEDKQISKILKNEGYVINRTTKKQRPDVKVFGYFKTEHRTKQYNNGYGLTYGFTEISDFIQDINTSVTKSGGTFRITLPLLGITKYGDVLSVSKTNGVWAKFINNGNDFNFRNLNNDNNSNAVDGVYYNIGDIHFKSTVKDNDNSLFEVLIQTNDLIFINFGDDIRSMEENIGMRCFEMIGLVDDVSLSQNANGSGCVVVSGRDLMKLITDDNSLFFNKSTAWGGSNVFANIESYEKTGDILSADMIGQKFRPVDRLRRLTNEINIFAYPNKTLDYVIKGVVQKLVNIEICPEQLFIQWGNRRTKFNDFEYDSNDDNVINNNELELNTEEEMQVDESLNIDLNMNNRGNSGNGAFDELINREKRPLTTSDIELGIIRLQ